MARAVRKPFQIISVIIKTIAKYLHLVSSDGSSGYASGLEPHLDSKTENSR